MNLRRVVAVAAATIALAVAAAPTAGADPAKPGNYRSIVDWVTPRTGAITAKVVGGDGFLELEVTRGHTVEVPGYTGEPWLRVSANGRVQENQLSQTTYINQNRYGSAATVQIPADATIANATKHPEWKTVDTNGRYVWHDHRIHYMTPSIKPTFVPGTKRVAIGERDDGRWVVRMTVDGSPTQVVGELLKEPAPNVRFRGCSQPSSQRWSGRRDGCCAIGRRAGGGRGTRGGGGARIAVGLPRARGRSRTGRRQPDGRSHCPPIAIAIALLALVLRAAAGRVDHGARLGRGPERLGGASRAVVRQGRATGRPRSDPHALDQRRGARRGGRSRHRGDRVRRAGVAPDGLRRRGRRWRRRWRRRRRRRRRLG